MARRLLAKTRLRVENRDTVGVTPAWEGSVRVAPALVEAVLEFAAAIPFFPAIASLDVDAVLSAPTALGAAFAAGAGLARTGFFSCQGHQGK